MHLNYVAHVTGHGWRKLMRLEEAFVYEITEPRSIPSLFKFMMEAGPINLREAYATFNMGVGFAAYVAPSAVEATLAAAKAAGHEAWVAGTVPMYGGRRAVTTPPLGRASEADTLQVR